MSMMLRRYHVTPDAQGVALDVGVPPRPLTDVVDGPKRPTDRQGVKAWAAYVVQVLGLTEDEVAGKSKDELVALVPVEEYPPAVPLGDEPVDPEDGAVSKLGPREHPGEDDHTPYEPVHNPDGSDYTVGDRAGASPEHQEQDPDEGEKPPAGES